MVHDSKLVRDRSPIVVAAALVRRGDKLSLEGGRVLAQLERENRQITKDIVELIEVLREARESLFQCGQNSATAWEHGDRVSQRREETEASEIHAKIDAILAKHPEAKAEA